MRSYANFQADFRDLFEADIRQCVDDESSSTQHGVIWYWDTAVEAAVEDKTVPLRALKWKPPAWLVKLDTQSK